MFKYNLPSLVNATCIYVFRNDYVIRQSIGVLFAREDFPSLTAFNGHFFFIKYSFDVHFSLDCVLFIVNSV